VSRWVTKVAQSEEVQMAIGEAAAAIDVATLLLHTGRESSTAAVSSGRKITEAEAVRARRDMVYAQHQVGWALDRLCELDGARWVYDSDQLGAIRRDVMTILTHHAASRQAAMAPYGRMLLAPEAG
jgi:acyl-CoA dehydrogenase-like protein